MSAKDFEFVSIKAAREWVEQECKIPLRDAYLNDANPTGADLQDVQWDKETKWPEGIGPIPPLQPTNHDMNNTIIPTRDQRGRVTDFTVTNTAPMTQSSSPINLRIQLPTGDYTLLSDTAITFCFYSETDEPQTIVSSSVQVTPVQLLKILNNRMGAL